MRSICLFAAPAVETFPCGGGVGGGGGGPAWTAAPATSCPPAVQVPEDVIVDLTGDLLLLQHPLNGLARRRCLHLLLLLFGLFRLETVQTLFTVTLYKSH